MKAKKIIWPKDSSEMMLLPTGSFEMGNHIDGGYTDELPVHEVELGAFYMEQKQSRKLGKMMKDFFIRSCCKGRLKNPVKLNSFACLW